MIDIIKVLFFCQLLLTSLAQNRKRPFELETLPQLLEKCTSSNIRQLDNHLINKIYVEKYTEV